MIKEEIDSEDSLIIVPTEEKKHRFSRKFTDDQVLEALSKVENGESVDEVAKNMGADRATIYNWAKKMSVNLPKKKRATKKKMIAEKRAEETEVKEEIKEEVKEEVVTAPPAPKQTSFPFKKISNTDATIKAMLINERHEFPCTKYIFDKVYDDKLFDFEWYERTAKNWIGANINKVNDVWLKGIDCYVTGLPAASIALCKVCKELEVNLTFLHYNKDTQGYEYQTVFDDFPVVNKNGVKAFGAYFADGIEIFVHENANLEELVNSNILYCISRRSYDKNATEAASAYDTRVKTVVTSRYLFGNLSDAYNCLPNIIEANNKSTTASIIVLNEVFRDGTYWNFKDAILKSQNPAFNDLIKNK